MEINLENIEKALKVFADQTYKIILPYRNSDGSFDGKKIKTEISKEDMELLEAYDLATLILENQIGYELICDICGEDFDFETFDDAVNYKRENGWKSEKYKGEWQDICPECQEG